MIPPSPKALIQQSARKFVLGLVFLGLASEAFAQTSAPQYFFSHLAGSLGGWGNADGVGQAARFNRPEGVAVDAAGNVYVADGANATIRKITPDGTVTTLAGTPGNFGPRLDGLGPMARFSEPSGLAVDGAGTVYVADYYDNGIRKVTPAGLVTTLPSGPTPGTIGNGNLALDAAGNIFVSGYDDRIIQKIALDGTVSTLAGTPTNGGTSVDGNGAAARFIGPTGLALDAAGNVFVADNSTIRKITPSGDVTTFAGAAGFYDNIDGLGVAARFKAPAGLAFGRLGNLFVTDNWAATIRQVTPDGNVTTLAGVSGMRGDTDGPIGAARFRAPEGIASDTAGNLYVSDYESDTIRKITPSGTVSTIAGRASARPEDSTFLPSEFAVDGTGAAARFGIPESVTVDGAGNVFVTDTFAATIRKITPAGVVTTFAGTAGNIGNADGTGPAAAFHLPTAITIDRAGNLYVTDNPGVVRKITPDAVVTTLAGTYGVTGGADGTGPNAQFWDLRGIAVDSAGNLYVADKAPTIRKITPGGVVTTLAGTFGVSGSADGVGAAAQFTGPMGIAVDAADNLYVTDADDYYYGNNGNETIRKITPGGVVTTLAGTAGMPGSADGTGPAARFKSPAGIAVDAGGNLYVVDFLDATVRRITPDGSVTTIGGTANVLGSLDEVGRKAQFNAPSGIAIDHAGNLYVADSANRAIRKGVVAGPPMITVQPLNATIAPGGSAQFSVTAAAVPDATYQWYFNGHAINAANQSTFALTNVQPADAGGYTVVVTNSLGSATSIAATLTVSTPSPSAGGSTSSSGGGACGALFGLATLALALMRRGRAK